VISLLPAPRHVFTADWVAAKQGSYGRNPAYARPVHYDLWTSDKFQARRDAIEALVDPLPERSRAAVIPRLRTEKHFNQTRAELAVGAELRRLGYELDYEAALFDGLTPDWYARHAARRPFVVEVVSSNPSELWTQCERAWQQFNHRLRALPGNAILSARPSRVALEPVGPPDTRQQKEIVRAVGRWLADGRSGGDRIAFDGVIVQFVAAAPGLTRNTTIRSTGLWVDGAPLRESVAGKASKYRDLVEAVGQPFVVVVVPDFFTGRGLDEVKDAVFGRDSWRAARPPAAGEGNCQPGNDGLFAEYPTLSAVALGSWQDYSITLFALRNPRATYPLPDDSLTPEPPSPEASSGPALGGEP
jgi:hypothetical protein